MTQAAANMQIAETILEQLGGRHFIAMTGCKNFGADKNTLRMQLTANAVKAKYLSITLNENDTYDMMFFSVNRDLETIVKAKKMGIYCDMLQKVFTSVTGLDTHL